MNQSQYGLLSGAAALAASCALAIAAPTGARAADAAACPANDSGLTLPAGFCATVLADGIGHARHLVVSDAGVVYVNTWSGRYFGNDTPHAGGFLVALKDSHAAGKADINERFGETVQSGGAGGTGIGIYKGWLYAELNDKILKYPLKNGSVLPDAKSQVVVRGLPLGGDHPMLRARPIRAKKKIAPSNHRASIHVRNSRRAAASGAMTPRKQSKRFRPRNGTRPAYAMRRASASIRSVIIFSSLSTAVISCTRTGRT
jgi:hypothetical protein